MENQQNPYNINKWFEMREIAQCNSVKERRQNFKNRINKSNWSVCIVCNWISHRFETLIAILFYLKRSIAARCTCSFRFFFACHAMGMCKIRYVSQLNNKCWWQIVFKIRLNIINSNTLAAIHRCVNYSGYSFRNT